MKIRNPRTGDYDFEIKITDTDRLSEQAKNSRAAQQKLLTHQRDPLRRCSGSDHQGQPRRVLA